MNGLIALNAIATVGSLALSLALYLRVRVLEQATAETFDIADGLFEAADDVFGDHEERLDNLEAVLTPGIYAPSAVLSIPNGGGVVTDGEQAG